MTTLQAHVDATVDQHVIGGVDTHKDNRHAAVIDSSGRLLGDEQFAATTTGLLTWLRSFGIVDAVGVEGTGSYGAALTRTLLAEGVAVVEVNRPSRAARRRDGKSDRLDSEQAARAVLAGTAWTPRTREVEEATKTVRELTIVGDAGFMSRLANVVAARSGYSGSWRLALQVHGLTTGVSATLADVFGVRLHPFSDLVYSRETTASFDELTRQPDRVAGRLVLPLLYALNSADHPLWEYLR